MKNNNNNKKNKNTRRRKGNNYSERGSSYFTSTNVPRIGFNPRQLVQLKYSDSYGASLLTLTATNQQFRCNSLFDPDYTGTGHQPYRFDQLATFYSRYRVIDFRWKVIFNSSSMPYWCAVGPTNGDLNAAVTNATTFNTATELPYFVKKAQCFEGGPPAIFTGRMKLNELGGTTPNQYMSDDRYQAQVTTNPAELLLHNVMLYNPTGSTIAIFFSVELWYEAEFFDPVILASS